MRKNGILYGIGINDADYKVFKTAYVLEGGKRVRKILWTCPFYRKWSAVIERCFCTKLHEKYPTYKDCTICEDWLRFSNFRAWMEGQDWQDKELDKDVLIAGNKH